MMRSIKLQIIYAVLQAWDRSGNDPDEVIRICIAEDRMQVAYACTTQEQLDTIEKVIFDRE